MKRMHFFFLYLSLAGWIVNPQPALSQDRNNAIFDGKSFQGWEGDTLNTWRIENGAIAGGSLNKTVPRNEFLATVGSYSDFVLRLKFKLEGSEGFINGGVQVHSKRIADPPNEMSGYQADIGVGYWGALYDESRRNKILAAPSDSAETANLVKHGQWNDYEIRCQDSRIRIYLNGQQTVDYSETDRSIPLSGKVALQVHGGGKVLVHYKDITIRELSAGD